jgi:hypothetical protein
VKAAKLIPAGYDIFLNVRYTPNDTAYTDHIQIGFTVAKEPPARRYVSLLISAPTGPEHFAIPPNNGNWQSPPAEATFLQDVELIYLMPHMHARGKDTKWTLEYRDSKNR